MRPIVILLALAATGCGRLGFSALLGDDEPMIDAPIDGDPAEPDAPPDAGCAATSEDCTNGIDDDCDGIADNGCSCFSGPALAAGGYIVETTATYMGDDTWANLGTSNLAKAIQIVKPSGNATLTVSSCLYNRGGHPFAWDGTQLACLSQDGNLATFARTGSATGVIPTTIGPISSGAIRWRAGGYDVLVARTMTVAAIIYYRLAPDGTTIGTPVSRSETFATALDILPIGSDLMAVWETGLSNVTLHYGPVTSSITPELVSSIGALDKPFSVVDGGGSVYATDGNRVYGVDRTNGMVSRTYSPIDQGGAAIWNGTQVFFSSMNDATNVNHDVLPMLPALNGYTVADPLSSITVTAAYTVSTPRLTREAGHTLGVMSISSPGTGTYYVFRCY